MPSHEPSHLHFLQPVSVQAVGEMEREVSMGLDKGVAATVDVVMQ